MVHVHCWWFLGLALSRVCGSLLDFVEKLEEFRVGIARVHVFLLDLVEARVEIRNTLVRLQQVVPRMQLSGLGAQKVVLHVV